MQTGEVQRSVAKNLPMLSKVLTLTHRSVWLLSFRAVEIRERERARALLRQPRASSTFLLWLTKGAISCVTQVTRDTIVKLKREHACEDQSEVLVLFCWNQHAYITVWTLALRMRRDNHNRKPCKFFWLCLNQAHNTPVSTKSMGDSTSVDVPKLIIMHHGTMHTHAR